MPTSKIKNDNIISGEKLALKLLVSPPDFYYENGFVVFTEAYHVKRGSCCKSGCRHCPYGYARKK